MAVHNTKNFENFILNEEITDEKIEDIKNMIEAFSEYIVAVNPEYVYNKAYLNTYVQDFIQCQKLLKQKYEILTYMVYVKIIHMGLEEKCIISIDDAWKIENGKISLNNSIDSGLVMRNKLQLELKFVHENEFVIAEEINLDDELENEIDKCIDSFIERRKEILEDEAE